MKKIGTVGWIALVVVVALGAATAATAADKVISFKGENYNVANVTKTSSRVEAEAGDEQIVGARDLTKKQFNTYVKKAGTVVVTTFIEFDDDEMVYQKVGVTSFGDFQNILDKLDKTMKDIAKFMGRKKGGVLKLK